jgi:hypothetical protein
MQIGWTKHLLKSSKVKPIKTIVVGILKETQHKFNEDSNL